MNKNKKILNSFFKIIYPYLQNPINKFWELFDSNIPKYRLENKHLKHTKIIKNRKEMLKLFPKLGVVAEIGVATGDFSKNILNFTEPKRLYLIDSWNTKRYHKKLHNFVKKTFSREIKSGKVIIKVGNSLEIADDFKNNFFDWIYIDTNHTYENTSKELEKYSKKVKKGGIISGHDYNIGNWNSMLKYGVIEAVNKFCVENNWELIYLTANYWESPSFAIKRI